MSPEPAAVRRPAEVVVGIGDGGHATYRAALRLGAEEAALRGVPIRLVHGSRPATWAGPAAPPGMESRQRRGRRLVNGAARDLAWTPLGQGLQIRAESSPQTGVDLLLAHARTAVMLVLQRADGPDGPDGADVPAGRTTREVIAAARCPTVVTRARAWAAGGVVVLVVLDGGRDPGPALALAFTEASLRGIDVRVVDGQAAPVDRGATRSAVRRAADACSGVGVHEDEVAADEANAYVRAASGDAALMVVVRPARAEPDGLLAAAVDQARCPVLMVVPVETDR